MSVLCALNTVPQIKKKYTDIALVLKTEDNAIINYFPSYFFRQFKI